MKRAFTALFFASISCFGAFGRPNILILVADDMRAFDKSEKLHLPNLDYLSNIGISFENTFAQQALCAPSRNSFLTSRRPDTLRLFDFYNYWRDFVGNFSTLPQFFKENGYRTYSYGKIFHPGKSSNFTDDYPYSWSEKPYHPSTEIYKESKVCVGENDDGMRRNLVCPVVEKFQPGKTLPDIQTTKAVINKLIEFKSNPGENFPYLMMVGLHKPHVPLKYPMKFLKYYPLSNISMPDMPFKPPSMPAVAWNHWSDIRERDDIKKLNISFPYGTMPHKWTLKIRQSYFAAMTYIDSLIGEILPHVDMKNTIIVFTSDHGWSLGEHGEWAKYSNFDVALRVPLIIYDPKQSKSFYGTKYDGPVELLDLFPTLAELSGVADKFPVCNSNNVLLCTEGKSLVPFMNRSNKRNVYIFNNYAISQYPRTGAYPTKKPDSDKPKLNQIKIMGYSVRTRRFRYTQWIKYDRKTFSPDWNSTVARELYDHTIDKGENLNLANRNEMLEIINELSWLLRKNQVHL